MEVKNIYTIDNKELNDTKCNYHDQPKPYTKYCLFCNKNLCDLCDSHKNHKILNFDVLDPGENKLQEYEEKLNQMGSINKDFFEKYLLSFKKRRNTIKKMLEDTNDIIRDIIKTSKRFENNFNYNKIIINAYKQSKNYYILEKYRQLNFVVDTKIYEKKWNTNNLELPELGDKPNKKGINKLVLNFNLNKNSRPFSPEYNRRTINNFLIQPKNPTQNEGFKNMWISEKYCKNWGLSKAIREFIQNQYDGIISKIQTKQNLIVVKAGKKININNTKVYLNFYMKNKEDNKIYGHINYDNDKKVLTISNEGILWLGDFLLGGSKDDDKNKDLIGQFGEGMKLAILALCRLSKNVTIISSDKKYNFIIKADQLFLKDNIPQRCLHFQYELFNNPEPNRIKVIINNIRREEWASQIINFLWLLDNDAQIYTSYDKYDNELGQILNEEYLRGKIYVKGIFVQDIKLIDKEGKADCLGFNVDIKLDRDRNCIPDNYLLKNIISSIISSFCNNNIKNIIAKEKEMPQSKEKNTNTNTKNININNIKIINNKTKHIKEHIIIDDNDNKNDKQKSDNINKDEILLDQDRNFEIDDKSIFDEVIKCINNDDINIINSYELADSLSQECIEYIWKKIYSAQDKKANPVYSVYKVTDFIEEKNLSKDFYPYFKVNYSLMKILEKSKKYLSVQNKFTLYVKNAVTVEPKGTYKKALNEIYTKVKTMKENFEGRMVEFKKFEREDKYFCFYDKKTISFSSIKLNEPVNNNWKFWIFVKILQFLNIKIEDNYQFINNAFEKNEKKGKVPEDENGAKI